VGTLPDAVNDYAVAAMEAYISRVVAGDGYHIVEAYGGGYGSVGI
jgi:hypothetical protein